MYFCAMKIALVVPYPQGKAPSQRFRFEQQFTLWQKQQVKYHFFPFLSENAFALLYQKGNYLKKALYILKGFFSRFLLLFQLKSFDFVFIHREATPIGPPIFEWIIAKVLRKKIIYDFDDAIWLPNTSDANKIVAGIKWHSKVKSICKWATKVSCGNEYLANFARQYNENVMVIPTTVDMQNVHNKTKEQISQKLVIGWTGTHSTIPYLYAKEDLLFSLQQEISFDFYVISNKDPKFQKVKYKYIEWNKKTEIEDLLQFNIGIMPLKNDKWAKGKCGFKAIQYMALGIPAVVDNVGVNAQIVDNQQNGILCENHQDWEKALRLLLKDEKLRQEYGKKAQEKIKNHYSKTAVNKKYLSLFT